MSLIYLYFHLNMMNTENAKIFENTDTNIKLCADYIKQGGIVGMPTETVYGLAANALNPEAVQKIFEYKGRPLSDPLIVHVSSIEMTSNLIKLDEETEKVFKLLTDKYWPGPMTLVVKANFDIISPIITANTDYIGVRMPKNDIARKLIEYSGVPIAAPSANKFCHVSPVNPLHVFEDFKEFPVYIIDGGVCSYCMESTVVKIKDDKTLQILRSGALSKEELSEYINGFDESYKVELVTKTVPVEDFKIDQEAPGQFIKHYSPKLDTYILDTSELNVLQIKPEECVIIDYKGILNKQFTNKFTTYLDLSPSGDAEEVMHNIYDYLRKAESVESAKLILICDIQTHMEDNKHKHTLVDRVLKASSHRKININI
jgi:L-threonylcarbamoyladenylate synthase